MMEDSIEQVAPFINTSCMCDCISKLPPAISGAKWRHKGEVSQK